MEKQKPVLIAGLGAFILIACKSNFGGWGHILIDQIE